MFQYFKYLGSKAIWPEPVITILINGSVSHKYIVISAPA